jgi:endoglucanase
MKLGLRRKVMWSATWAAFVSIGAAACAADAGDDLKSASAGVVTTPPAGGGSSGASTSSSGGSGGNSGTEPPPTDDASDDATASGDDATAPASDAGPPVAASCTTCPISLQYMTSNKAGMAAGDVSVDYRVLNQGSSPQPMGDLKIRYWFATSGGSLEYDPDYASVDVAGGGPVDLKADLMSAFVAAPHPTAGAMQYLELSFSAAAASIPPSLGATLQGRIHTVNYASMLDPSQDYSFDAADTALTPSMTSTVYRDGTLVWGVEP